MVEGADVVVTGTHARGGLVDAEWVSPGTHIAALGADLEGEQELDPAILSAPGSSSTTSASAGSTARSTSPSGGLISEEDVAGEIGKVIAGELEGLQSDDQITVFDSTGIALRTPPPSRSSTSARSRAGVGVEKKMIST